MDLPSSNFETLEDGLSELFGESVTIEGGEQRKLGAAELSIVEIGYRREHRSSDGPTTYTHVRQTALVSTDAELDLPQFALTPTPKGISGRLLSLFGDMGDIDFPDSPEFSTEYHLHGWSEKPVRLLFTKPIRDHFSGRLGWSVMGKRNVLAIFHHNQVIDGNERKRFVDDALEILALFQRAEEQLDGMPDVRRETTPSDFLASAERMGGLVGGMLAKQLQKLSVTSTELDNFLSQSPPRAIPKGIKNQLLGEGTTVLMVAGSIFLIVGLVVGVLITTLAAGNERWIGIPIMTVFPLIGSLMVYFTARYRNRKKRTLKCGAIVECHVNSVEGTSTSINEQRRYHVEVEYSQGGKATTGIVHAYGPAVDKARKFEQGGDAMRVLVDPSDPTHLIGIDLIMIFEQ